MNSPRVTQINKLIKASAKLQNLTYSQLAKRLEVSEPTIKRWLRGDGINVQQWLQLIDTLGIRFSDIASALDEPSLDQFECTEKQERMLADTEGLLAFFQSLLSGASPLEIMKKHGLSKVSTTFYLKKLDEIGLVEWTEGLTCKLKVQGDQKWKKNGPLSKKFREQLINEFIWPRKNADCFRLGIYELAKTDGQELTGLIAKVFETAKNLEKKARILKLKTETLCIGTCLDQHRPDFLYEIPVLKSK